MNPLLLSVADGTIFFVGMLVVVLFGLLLLKFHSHRVRPVLTVFFVLGVILVIISSTPISIWLYALWGTSALTCLALLNLKKPTQKLRIAAWAISAMASLVLVGIEIPYLIRPTITADSSSKVFVIGDSLSAGMGTKHVCWPEVLDKNASYRVFNLAKAGGTVSSAFGQAKQIDNSVKSIVVIEIGGNDLLGGTPSMDYWKYLDKLVSQITANGHQVLIMELPLYPFANVYGQAQREVAIKYKAALLPKRFFARVLATENGTLDGLHLSQEGHNAMASIVGQVIQK